METPQRLLITHGTIRWYQHRILSRLDGPAMENPRGERSWYQRGVRHRTEGPAVVYSDGGVQYWLNGVLHTPSSFVHHVGDQDQRYIK